jgi:hypothetical protein
VRQLAYPSEWLKEGYFISYTLEGTTYYEHIIAKDFAHWEYEWFEAIEPGVESGPKVPDQLVLTKKYDPNTNTNQIWQLIFGIMGEVYVYIELPTDTHRHGIPKVPKPSSDEREVSHFEEWMSPFYEPSFITEHIMIRPNTDRIAFSVYNPHSITITPRLNIFIAKMVTERIGTERNGVLTPTSVRWKEILDRLYRRVVAFKPLTLLPVYAPPSE